jgi:4-hydroxy-3-polyprenylbenzoate decarboxylase
MAYPGLTSFVSFLENNNEIIRISSFVDPLLEVSEITDRISKNSGKALLFENNGTNFSILINAFGSDKRIAMAIGRDDINEVGSEIQKILLNISEIEGSIIRKITALPYLIKLAAILPVKTKRKGICQQIIHLTPDLSILPVLKCWPHDAGRFITLPMVHTIHPETGKTNVGMYRMQILDNNSTAMHWQRHKTGANHYDAYKRLNKKMPVSVALGGDPVYAYSATAPLPENLNEYILAGFLRKKKVRLVKCVTNDLFVPYDADIVIEGYVDPSEELVKEGPFGDHTGFYSLSDWYPRFHVTCITHSKNAIYPATIVGIPPQEDAWLAKATERIFLSPIRLTLQPEIDDFHMPDAGIAHNLVIVKINKTYPGQGMKIINSLLGAGQMMFTKYLVVVSGKVDIRNYKDLIKHVFMNIDLEKDLLFSHGPMDVLDHSSDTFSFGGKAGVDATVKLPEELPSELIKDNITGHPAVDSIAKYFNDSAVTGINLDLINHEIPVLILAIDCSQDANAIEQVKNILRSLRVGDFFRLILAVDHTVDPFDYFMTTWQMLGNTDPQRDHEFISPASLFLDGTIKAFRKGGFTRKWPNIVCSSVTTINSVDQKWESLQIGSFITSPSLRYKKLLRDGDDEVIVKVS